VFHKIFQNYSKLIKATKQVDFWPANDQFRKLSEHLKQTNSRRSTAVAFFFVPFSFFTATLTKPANIV